MLSLFTRSSGLVRNYALKLYPEWRYIHNKLLDNVKAATIYCRSIELRAKTDNNPLYRFLNNYCPNISLTDIDFYIQANNSIDHADSMLGFVSFNNPGKPNKEIIYTNCMEVFSVNNGMLKNKYFDNDLLWKNLKPLKLTYTTNTTLDYCILNNKKKMDGLVMYEVNLIKLLFQYKKWCNFRMMNYKSIDAAVYLQQYVYPSIAVDLVNHTIFNRLMYFVSNTIFPTNVKEKYYPFFIEDLTEKIDKVIFKFVNEFENRKTLIEVLINSIPNLNLGKEDTNGMLRTLRLDVLENIKNMSWIPYLTRFPYIVNLYKLLGEEGTKFNKYRITELQDEIKAYATRMVKVPKYIDEKLVFDMEEAMRVLNEKFLGAAIKLR